MDLFMSYHVELLNLFGFFGVGSLCVPFICVSSSTENCPQAIYEKKKKVNLYFKLDTANKIILITGK